MTTGTRQDAASWQRHKPRQYSLQLMAFVLLWCSLGASALAASHARDEDAFLAGAITTIVEREWGWARDSYRLTVDHGVATLVLLQNGEQRRNWLATHPIRLEGLDGVNVRVETASATSVPPEPISPARQEVYSFLGLTPDTTPFPVGDLFWPLVADPKQPQFFVSFRHYDTPQENISVAAVGYGETFGLYRREGKRPGDGLQLSIVGGLFAQFNLDAPSKDLVNADYTIGMQATYRHGRDSVRLRVYHQSSHLGDEFLLRAHPTRINLSFESLELLYSRDWAPWRVYAGGEYLLHREPSDLKRAALHSGVEFHGQQAAVWDGRWVGGADFKAWQEHDWATDTSVKFGLEFGAARPGRRRLRVMAEAYKGYAPHGQFYDDRIKYAGIGIYLGF